MNGKIIVEKDADGHLARINGYDNLFAFVYSEHDALIELKNVVIMIMDHHLERLLFPAINLEK